MNMFPIVKSRVNIHHSINYKSWRANISNCPLHEVREFYMGMAPGRIQASLVSQVPRNTYGLYQPHISRIGSKYPKDLSF